MRLSVVFVVAALGCSGSSFEVAATTDGAVADSVADAIEETTASDTSTTDSAEETSAPDAVPEVVATSCAKGSKCAGTGEYCKLAHCDDMTGTCESTGPVSTVYDPVCGCDGITYWSASFAASYGMSIAHTEPCIGSEGMTCALESDCGAGGTCVHDLTATGGACTSAGKGRCWRKPVETDCGKSPGGNVQTCLGACKTRCQAVKDKSTFRDSTCMP